MDDAMERAVSLVVAEAGKQERVGSTIWEFFYRGYIKGVAAALGVDREALLRAADSRWRSSVGLENDR